MSSNSDEEEEKNVNQRKDDKGKGQSSQGSRNTQSFKRSEASSSSSSGGFSVTVRGEVVDLLVVPDSRDMEMLVEEMYLCAVGAIKDTLKSVGEDAVDALHVVRWAVVCRGEVIKLMEVVGDDNKPKDVLIISHCRMLRAIQI